MTGQTIGPYRVLREVGKGGMGAVYEAIHPQIERKVAIKVLHPEYAVNQSVVQRFFNEARAVNIVNHPSVVQISEFGQQPDGMAYIVMEFLEGESLGARMKRFGGKLSIADTLRLTRQVAAALAAAHAKNIVHRENYIISMVCFHVGHLGPQRRRNKPCPLTVPAVARSALTSH